MLGRKVQGDRQTTGHLGAPQSREQAMMDTGTQTQIPSHWVERTFLKSCSRTLPTPTRPRSSHCPASACALQFAGSARLAAARLPGITVRIVLEKWPPPGRGSWRCLHTGRRGGQASSMGFPATPLPGGPAACLGSHTANTDAEPRAVPPRGGASSGAQPGA